MAGRSEWRGLSRALRSGKRYEEPSGWSALAGWIWRHHPELLVLLVVVLAWRWLAGFLGGLLAVLPLLALVVGAVVWPPSRKVLAVVAGWRLTRHRLRAGLLEARVTTPSGRLPVYLGSWPTSVGERVWLWCPPGLAAEDLEDETERLRAACIAREIRINRDVRFSALVVAHAALSLDCRLVLVDGKRVELGVWKQCADVFVGPSIDEAIRVLKQLQTEMD